MPCEPHTTAVLLSSGLMLELLVCIQCSGKRQQREDKQKKYHILNAHLVPAASD